MEPRTKNDRDSVCAHSHTNALRGSCRKNQPRSADKFELDSERPRPYLSLNGILSSPLPGRRFVSRAISLVDVCDFRNKRVVRVGVSEHGADREKDWIGTISILNGLKHVQVECTFGDSQSGTPLVSQDIKAYTSVGVDVRMINASSEVYFWWFKGIVGWEMNRQKEDTTRVWTLTLYIFQHVRMSLDESFGFQCCCGE